MANTRFGNFSELSQGKKPMTAEEAWIMLNELGLLGQEFVPGATSVRKLMEGKPKEAVEELQDWIPGNAAYQNFIRGKDQDWVRNALDLAIVGKPLAKGAKKAAEAIERMPKGSKEGFVRNPNFNWNSLTPEQKKATQQALEEWTGRAKIHNAGRQTPPVSMVFLDDNLNDAVMNIAGDYKFTPKVAGQLNRNIKTQAILPENTGEAAFLRHSPYMSNYDRVLNTASVANEENRLMKAGLLPEFRRDYYGPDRFSKTFPTEEGPYADIGNNAKAMIIDELERKFPGYRNVMEGHGPGQAKYENDRIYTSYMLNPTEEEIIQRKSDAILHDIPSDQLDEVYKQHKNFYENEIERLQERLDYIKTEPKAEQERLSDLYKMLEHKQEFIIQARKALENAYNERVINDL